MRCRAIEKLIVDAHEGALEPEDEMRLTDHLRVCAACARFRDDIARVLESPESAELPADLDRRTKERCLALLAGPAGEAGGIQKVPGRAVPVWLKAVLALLVVLTTAWVVPLFDLPEFGEKVPWEAGVAILILVQNGLVLVLSPVLLRRRHIAGSRRGSLFFTKTSA